ncbi:hypothetical protein GGS21DRAFT_532947 [Xylaria nigripes]|nr:hypothetical protein GGS21DRAFT_532947 [Xylaria nigripes]
MDTEDIEYYIGDIYSDEPTGDARKTLVNELRKNNPEFDGDLQHFKDLVGKGLKIRIISVYERKPSRRVIQISQVQNELPEANPGTSVIWKREGNAYNPLTKREAVLGLPELFELQIPSNSDHSNMAKFDHKDETYHGIVDVLQELSSKPIARGSSVESNTAKTPRSTLMWLRDMAEYYAQYCDL